MIVHSMSGSITNIYSLSLSMLNLIYTPAGVSHTGKKKVHLSNISSYYGSSGLKTSLCPILLQAREPVALGRSQRNEHKAPFWSPGS